MRAPKTLFVLLAVAAVALGQERGGEPLPPARGGVLLAALPERADLVIHTPDLPALLATAEPAGLGGRALWRAAFRAQLERWGAPTGAPERLVAGGEALLKAADGEALVASMRLPARGGPSRATLLALRSSRPEKALRGALRGILDGGLAGRYPGIPRQEQIQSRPVHVLSRPEGRLYVAVQDGLVAVADHPLALGLLFRGLETAGAPEEPGAQRLEVRYGRGKERWTGWVYGAKESVSWQASADVRLLAHTPTGPRVVVAAAVASPEDTPLLPAPPSDWIADLAAPPGRAATVLLLDDGETAACVANASGGEGARPVTVVVRPDSGIDVTDLVPLVEPLAGGASHARWLRAYASGTLALPLPAVDVELLVPMAEFAEAALDSAWPFHAWTTTDQSGEVRGPPWHGPATMLALRTLHDLARGRDPGPAFRRGTDGAPLPAPAGGASLPGPADDRAPPREE